MAAGPRRMAAGSRRMEAASRRMEAGSSDPAGRRPCGPPPERCAEMMSFLAPLVPVIPILIVTLSACAVLVNEALRRETDKLPPFSFGLFALIGLVGAMVSSRLLWNGNQIGFGVVVLDNFAVYFN